MNPQPEPVSTNPINLTIGADGANVRDNQISIGNIAGRDVIIHQYFT